MITHLDLAACLPRTALSGTHRPAAWLTVFFRTTAGQTGTALYAGAHTAAPPVTLKLNATGWHEIRVGLWSNWSEIQPYLGTDFTHLFWGTGVGGDIGAYPSDLLSLAGAGQLDSPRPGDHPSCCTKRFSPRHIPWIRARWTSTTQPGCAFARRR